MESEKKQGVIILYKYRQLLEKLTNEEQGKILMAALLYDETGQLTEFDNPVTSMLFAVMKIDIDNMRDNWEKAKNAKSEAGKRGMAKRWNTKPAEAITEDNGNNGVKPVITDNNKDDDVSQNITGDNKDNSVIPVITEDNKDNSVISAITGDNKNNYYDNDYDFDYGCDNNPPNPPSGGTGGQKTRKSTRKDKNDEEERELLRIFLEQTAHYSAELKQKVHDWILYKARKKSDKYEKIGLECLLAEVDEHQKTYGDLAVIDLISHSMASTWKSIAWGEITARSRDRPQGSSGGGINIDVFLENNIRRHMGLTAAEASEGG